MFGVGCQEGSELAGDAVPGHGIIEADDAEQRTQQPGQSAQRHPGGVRLASGHHWVCTGIYCR